MRIINQEGEILAYKNMVVTADEFVKVIESFCSDGVPAGEMCTRGGAYEAQVSKHGLELRKEGITSTSPMSALFK